MQPVYIEADGSLPCLYKYMHFLALLKRLLPAPAAEAGPLGPDPVRLFFLLRFCMVASLPAQPSVEKRALLTCAWPD